MIGGNIPILIQAVFLTTLMDIVDAQSQNALAFLGFGYKFYRPANVGI